MIKLPIRVELRDRSSDRSCGFTIYEQFLDYPTKGDRIIIPDGLSAIGCFLSVIGRLHFCLPDESPSILVSTSPYLVEKYDDMLKLLDRFKDQYEILDLKADSDPASYYSFYRSVIRLLDWKPSKKLTGDDATATMKVFSAGASSVLVAEYLVEIESPTVDDYVEAYAKSSVSIETLLNVILNKKQSDEHVDLLAVVKEWEPLVNPDATLCWKASEDRCLSAAKFIFQRIKSIPADMLPDGLK